MVSSSSPPVRLQTPCWKEQMTLGVGIEGREQVLQRPDSPVSVKSLKSRSRLGSSWPVIIDLRRIEMVGEQESC